MDFKSITSAKNTPEKVNPFLEKREETTGGFSDEERIGDFAMKKSSSFENFQVQVSSQEGSEKNFNGKDDKKSNLKIF